MGMSMAAGALAMVATTALSYALTPKSPSMDMTNYDMLRQTQAEADAESEAAKARQDEARRREELRTQQMYGQDIKTSEVGAKDLDVKETTLGADEDTAE